MVYKGKLLLFILFQKHDSLTSLRYNTLLSRYVQTKKSEVYTHMHTS